MFNSKLQMEERERFRDENKIPVTSAMGSAADGQTQWQLGWQDSAGQHSRAAKAEQVWPGDGERGDTGS